MIGLSPTQRMSPAANDLGLGAMLTDQMDTLNSERKKKMLAGERDSTALSGSVMQSPAALALLGRS